MDKMLGHRSSTHVANASDKPIYAKVEMEKPKVESVTYRETDPSGCSRSATVDFKTDQLPNGYTRVAPGQDIEFQPEGSGYRILETKTVLVSVITEQNGANNAICNNLPLKENQSVIITEDEKIVETKMGSVWTDKYGNDHSRE